MKYRGDHRELPELISKPYAGENPLNKDGAFGIKGISMHERAHLETLLNALGVRSRRLQPVVAHEVCLFDRAARVFV